ncbi:MAG TPA: ATP-binding protein [Cyclobacteriaceae bacterium]|jgi:signal transduction histidine kinase|nr:ATP-binding protein [Cyclobacteriaceae bacterium]
MNLFGTKSSEKKLPWWTWVAPLPIFFLGTLISLEAKISSGTSLFYLPIPFALVLTYWWGPRVLLTFYLNATLCAGLWGLETMILWPVYGSVEVIFAFLSWLLFVRVAKGNVTLPNTRNIIYFLLMGILIPLMVYKIILELVFLLAGDAPSDKYWNLVITTGFGDFISSFCISLPLLFFLGKTVIKRGLTLDVNKIDNELETKYSFLQLMELLGIGSMAYLINYYLSFVDYWFLNGILSLYIAIRFGFASAILMNSYILIITYFIPAATQENFSPGLFLQSEMLKTQLGTGLLYVFTTITARLVSDMRLSEHRLNKQNKELNLFNSELDRFVYSVSHDLSAPLKSILGLVNISRLTNSETEHRKQFDLIEKSVGKLETFVQEVLDYSRNKRMDVHKDAISLKELCQEVFEDLQFMDGVLELEIDLTGIETTKLISDRVRLKVILRNIISNAIKFRKRNLKAVIKVSSKSLQDRFLLLIEDNGEGIRPEIQPKIFEMFFRGNERSNGSGLGLYIAREAARRIDSEILVKSEFGKGSEFTIVFQREETLN